MSSMPQYKGFDVARIEQMIDRSLSIALRAFILVFFVLISALSLMFAVTVTCLCFCAFGLRVALRLVSSHGTTQRMFALAGC